CFNRSNCCSGSSSTGVKPAACRSRQKSLRGFAKCAWAAADTRPGLIPQKSTRRSGARTSGIADSGCFGLAELDGVTCFEELLEANAQRLAFERELAACAPGLEPHDPDGVLPAAVAPGVTLSLAE